MEEPSGLDDSGEGTLEHPRSQRSHNRPLPPPRHESYHLKLNDGYVAFNNEAIPDIIFILTAAAAVRITSI